jgi:hypothetical protein
MDLRDISRRELLIRGSAALAGLMVLQSPLLAQAFPSRPGEEVIPWMAQPPVNLMSHVVSNLPPWEELDSWITPNAKFFRVAHCQGPAGPLIDTWCVPSVRHSHPGLCMLPIWEKSVGKEQRS